MIEWVVVVEVVVCGLIVVGVFVEVDLLFDVMVWLEIGSVVVVVLVDFLVWVLFVVVIVWVVVIDDVVVDYYVCNLLWFVVLCFG